jgi:hypothetical protein
LADITIESLQVEIQAPSSEAAKSIDAVTATLSRLKNATKGLGLTGVVTQVKSLNTAFAAVNAADSAGVGRVINALKGLSSIGKTNLNPAINQLNKVPGTVAALASVNLGGFGTQVSQLTAALAPLSNMGKNNLGSFISQLQKLPQVTNTINSIDMGALSAKVRQLASAFAPLGAQMAKISSGFSAFPAKINAITNSTNALTKSNNKGALSYVNFAAKMTLVYAVTRKVLRAIGDMVKQSTGYVEDLNLFTASMGKYAEQAQG